MQFDPFGTAIDLVGRDLIAANAESGEHLRRFMPIDLRKTGDGFLLEADLPGVDAGSIDLTVEDGTLTIAARRSVRGEDHWQWLANERITGTYRRQLALADSIDTDNIKASYDVGVLTVQLPLTGTAKPRKVAIDTGKPQQALTTG